MRKADEMYAWARNHKMGMNITPLIGGWLQRKHFKLIENALGKDEDVISTFIGRHHPEDTDTFDRKKDETDEDFQKRVRERQTGKVRYFACKGFTAYAVTNAGRLIFARWVPFNNDYKSIPLNNINTINPNTNIFWGSLRVESFAENFSVFWTKRVVFEIAKLLQDSKIDLQDGVMDGIPGLTGGNPPQKAAQQPAQHSTEGNYEKLKERKKALDDGLITQEEYDRYKEEFLK